MATIIGIVVVVLVMIVAAIIFIADAPGEFPHRAERPDQRASRCRLLDHQRPSPVGPVVAL